MRMMKDAKFYVARRDTRWDVYPQQEPEVFVAHDWHGFWALTDDGEWFKTPTSYVLIRQIDDAKEDLEAFLRDHVTVTIVRD